jgi:hypothetical protein
VIPPQLLGLPTSVLPRCFLEISVDLDQVIAVHTVDQPEATLLARKGGVADRPASSMKDEKEFLSLRGSRSSRTSFSPGRDLG